MNPEDQKLADTICAIVEEMEDLPRILEQHNIPKRLVAVRSKYLKSPARSLKVFGILVIPSDSNSFEYQRFEDKKARISPYRNDGKRGDDVSL